MRYDACFCKSAAKPQLGSGDTKPEWIERQKNVTGIIYDLTPEHNRLCHFKGPTTCLMHSELSHTEEKNRQGRQETGFPHQHCMPLH
jgi:hypothetical protein